MLKGAVTKFLSPFTITKQAHTVICATPECKAQMASLKLGPESLASLKSESLTVLLHPISLVLANQRPVI